MCSPACVFARYLMGVAFCWLRLCFWTDVDGVHSAYYSDDTCATLVPASTDTWNDAPMDQCTQHNEYTLEPSCVDTLPPSLAELSSFSGYMDDDTCSTPAQAISTQYFVTNQRSEEHTSELQSLMRISYAVFCLKKKNKNTTK